MMLTAATLLLSGCNAGTDEAAQAVESFLNAIAQDDIVKAREFVNDPDALASIPTLARELGLPDDKVKRLSQQFTDIKYTVGATSKTEDGSGAVVVVTLTIPDYAPIAKASLLKHQAAEDTAALAGMVTDMADQTPDKVKKSAAVTLVKQGEKWIIDLSGNNLELLNCIYGNIQSALLPYQQI